MQNKEDFSEILRLARSPAGQQLMALLRSQHPDTVAAVQEDPRQAQSALSGLLTDPRAQALLRQLQEDYHG